MHNKIFRKLLNLIKSPLPLLTLPYVLNSIQSNSPTDPFSLINMFPNPLSPNRTHCLTTTRANKPQIVKLLSEAKEEVVILIYNRESEKELRDKIVGIEELVEELGIGRVIIVDQTDVRHLQSFANIIRQGVDTNTSSKQKQPIDLKSAIKILYLTPKFATSQPFQIPHQSIKQTITQIRQILHYNPTPQVLTHSLNLFNCTTVIKNCYNQSCIEEYKEKIRELLELEFFRDKQDGWKFFVTATKQDAQKIAGIIGQGSNKSQIYVFRNDILGKARDLYSQFLEGEGAKYQPANKFLMMIRPRVHVLSKKSLNTDLYWYISCLRNNSVPTFSINNTINNFPVRYIHPNGSNPNKIPPTYLKGHVAQTQLLQKLKQKYKSNIQLLVMQTQAPSQLFRHMYQPQRYCIFKLSPEIPYPKMLIKPPVLDVHVGIWGKMIMVGKRGHVGTGAGEEGNANTNGNGKEVNTSKQGIQDWMKIQGDPEDYNGKWSKVMGKVDKFMQKPINYDNIKLLHQKQMQINAVQLQTLIENSQHMSSSPNKQSSTPIKFMFRICGPRNPCLYSLYEKYGIDISTKVYKLDGQVQNVDIRQGDYVVEGGNVEMLG